MSAKKMPVVFAGHGSPMMALEKNAVTETLAQLGREITDKYGKPKAILAISGHWFTPETYVQRTAKPEQIYDMYGFPQELYDVKYPAKGELALSDQIGNLLEGKAKFNNDWGIDHGTWTVLVHMFPDADIPVIQLSVNGNISAEESYQLGMDLAPLREEGVLIMGSGNIVHNLRAIDFSAKRLDEEAQIFLDAIVDAIKNRDDETVINYRSIKGSYFAVPTPDHFLPLLYILGASKGEKPIIINAFSQGNSVDMTGFVFEGAA